MSANTNQHYVPKGYFRRFSSSRNSICLLLARNGKLKLDAPIKGQCAASNFHPSKEIEREISALERLFLDALQAFDEFSWGVAETELEYEDRYWVEQATLFQLLRTKRNAVKRMSPMCALQLYLFREYLISQGQTELVEEIDAGRVQVKGDPRQFAMQNLSFLREAENVISDLSITLLRNHTSNSFIFSDNPVVLVNTYFREIKSHGVLGLRQRGLQIFYPMGPKTLLMFADLDSYDGYFTEHRIIDLYEDSDVSQLNALQIHNCDDVIYFGGVSQSEYIRRLWRSHRHMRIKQDNVFDVRKELHLDGQRVTGEFIHVFEPQINHKLNLSFMSAKRIPIGSLLSPEELFRKDTPLWKRGSHAA